MREKLISHTNVYFFSNLQLIEFEDTDDNANLSAANPNTTHRYTLSSDTVPWANSTAESRLDENLIIFKIEQNYSDAATGKNVNFMSGGSFTIKVSYFIKVVLILLLLGV